MARALAGIAAVVAGLVLPAAASAATFTVTTTADSAVGDASCLSASCTLRQALTAANAAGGVDTVTVPAGVYHLANGELTSTDQLFLNGAGSATTTIDADGLSRVLSLSSATTVADMTITGGNVTGTNVDVEGGGIRSTAPLALEHVAITDNHVATTAGAGGPGAFGGGVWINEQLSPSDVTFTDNSADATGSARATGGALFLGPDGASNLFDLSFTDNRASADDIAIGGALASYATGTTQMSATFTRNTADAGSGGSAAAAGGAAFFTDGTSVVLSESRFTDNTAQVVNGYAQGGGLVTAAPSVTITDTTFDANTVSAATGSATGGGLLVGGAVTLSNSTIIGNTSTGPDASGGGASFGVAYALTTVAMDGVTLTRNSADTGGGISLVRNTTVTPTGSILSGNTAGTDADCTLLPGPGARSVTSGGGNVLGSASICGASAAPTDAVSATPGVGALGDHGGLTPTALLSAASPAVDLYTGCPAGFDQRGIDRPQSSACDAGAVEMRAATFTAAPSSLAFGSVNVGTLSPTQNVTITNAGDFADTPALALAGGDRTQFTLSGCAAAVAGGATCAASIGFLPTGPGFKAASLAGATPSVTLSGTGVSTPPPSPPSGGGALPQCRDLAATTPFGTAFAVRLECSATVWNWAITRAPEHGTLSPITSDGDIGYTPDTGFSGDDSFAYVAQGPGGQSAPATVRVQVGPGPASTASSTTGGRSCPPRRVTVRLNPRGVHFVRATVSVDGVGVQPAHKGSRWTASFELKGKPGQQVEVTIRGRRTDGRLLTRTRTLTVC